MKTWHKLLGISIISLPIGLVGIILTRNFYFIFPMILGMVTSMFTIIQWGLEDSEEIQSSDNVKEELN